MTSFSLKIRSLYNSMLTLRASYQMKRLNAGDPVSPATTGKCQVPP